MGKLKRCLAGFLAVATVLSSSNIAYAAQGLVKDDVSGKTVYKATEAESVAVFYESQLSEQEIAVLKSSMIAQGILPDAELPTDSLVTVDTGTRTITAKAYVDESQAYKWIPDSVTTVSTNGTVYDGPLNFSEKEGAYVANYENATGAFSAQVSYALFYNVGIDAQKRVLGIPKILVDGMTYMNDLSELYNTLYAFQMETVFAQVKEARDELRGTLTMSDEEIEDMIEEYKADGRYDDELRKVLAGKGDPNSTYEKALAEAKTPGSDVYKEIKKQLSDTQSEVYQKALKEAKTPGSDVYNEIYGAITDKNGSFYEEAKNKVSSIGSEIYNAIVATDGDFYKDAINKNSEIGGSIYNTVKDTNGTVYQDVVSKKGEIGTYIYNEVSSTTGTVHQDAINKGSDIGGYIYEALTKDKDVENSLYNTALNNAKDPTNSFYQKALAEVEDLELNNPDIDKLREYLREEAYAVVRGGLDALPDGAEKDALLDNADKYHGKGAYTDLAESKTSVFDKEFNANFKAEVTENFGTFIELNFDSIIDEKFSDIVAANYSTIIEENYEELIAENYEAIINKKYDDLIKTHYVTIVNQKYEDIIADHYVDIIDQKYETIIEKQFDKVIDQKYNEIIDVYFDEVLKQVFDDILKQIIRDELNAELEKAQDMLDAIDAIEADINDGDLDYYNAIKVISGSKLPFYIQMNSINPEESEDDMFDKNEALSDKFGVITEYINAKLSSDDEDDPIKEAIQDYASVIGDLENLIADLEAFANPNIEKANNLKAVLATPVYAENSDFEALVSALMGEGITLKAESITPAETWLNIYHYNVAKVVNAASVTITVGAKAASDEIDAIDKLRDLGMDQVTIPMEEGLEAKEIAERIDKEVAKLLGDENTPGLIAKWKEAGYDVNDATVYQEAQKNNYPEKVEIKETPYECEVLYIPRQHKITYSYLETECLAYHGSKIQLPEYDGEGEKTYDYKVYDVSVPGFTYESYSQGAVISVEHALKIDRNESERSLERLLNILQKSKGNEFVVSAADLSAANTAVKAILESSALRSPDVSIKYPSADILDPIKKVSVTDANGVSYDQHYTKAINVLLGMDGMVWVPTDAVLIKKDANDQEVVLDIAVESEDLEEDALGNGGKVFRWVPGSVEYDYLRVNYEMKIKTIVEDNQYVALNAEKVDVYLNLLNTIVDEVKDHKYTLEKEIDPLFVEIAGNEKLAEIMSPNALGLLNGRLSAEGNKAINEILKTNKGDTLNLYAYLEAICPPVNDTDRTFDVANYLYNGYSAKIKEEARALAPHLRTIANDTNLKSLLEEFGYASDDSMLEKIRNYANDLDGENGLVNKIEDLSDWFVLTKEDGTNNQEAFTTLIKTIVGQLIENEAVLKTFTAADVAKGIVASWSGTTNAPGKLTVTISVTGPKGTFEKVQPLTVDDETATSYEVTAADEAKINALYQAVKEEAGIHADNYSYYKDVEILHPVKGSYLDIASSKAFHYAYTFVAKEYTEAILEKGMPTGKVVPFTGTDTVEATIFLPKLEDTNYKYVYTIVEKVETAEGVIETVTTTVDTALTDKYTVKNLKAIALGSEDSLVISREKYSLETDRIDGIVDAFNNGLKGSGASFVKVKDYTGEAANGTYKAIVMSMDADVNMDALLTGFGTAIADVVFKTNYIGFGADGNDIFLNSAGEDGAQVYMQAMINLLLQGEISLEKLAEMTDDNGKIKSEMQLTFDKNVTVENNGKALGGKLVESGIKFVNDTEKSAIPFYITLNADNEKAQDSLKSIKNVQESYGNNVSMGTYDGTVAVDATIPEKVYTLYLTVMMMAGVIEEADLGENELNLIEQIRNLEEKLAANFKLEEVNYELIETTINTYLFNGEDEAVSLKPYATIIDGLIKIVDALMSAETGKDVYKGDLSVTDVICEGGLCAFTMTYDIKNLLAESDAIGKFADFLGENTKLTIPMSFNVLNISAGVEAIVLDWGQSGLSKLQYVDSVVDYLNTEIHENRKSAGPVYVYLLENISVPSGAENTIYIDAPTILNLNGFTVTTDIVANASLRIVDSEIDANMPGAVFGIITDNGNYVRLAAGNYPLYESIPNFGNMIREGYDHEDGTVKSQYYTISKNEETKTIEVALSTQVADVFTTDMQSLLLDMLSDILFNVYTVGEVSVNGKELFSADLEGLMDNYTGLDGVGKNIVDSITKNTGNVKDLVDDIFTEFGDTEKLANLVAEGGDIAKFDMATATWGVKVRLLENDDQEKYLGLELGTDDPEEYAVKIFFADRNPELAESLRAFKDLVTFKRSFRYEGVEFNNGSVDIKAGLNIDLLVDFTKNLENDPQKSSDYVTAMAAILAYSLEDEDKKEDLVEAIIDYENDIYAGALEDAFDALTVEEFVNAVKAAKEVSFEEIITDLGLRNVLYDSISVEACYAPVLEIVYNMVDYVDRALSVADREQQRIEIYENALGSDSIKNVDKVIDEETGKTLYVKTYGRTLDTPFGKDLYISMRMKLFSENYVPPVDDAINALNELPSMDEIYKVDAEGNVVVDNREKYIPVIAEARAAYDKLSEALKDYVPAELYEKLLEIEEMYNSWGVWVAELEAVDYTGKAYKPVDEVHVYDGAKRLTYKDDYTLSYQYNVNAADKDSAKAPRVIVKLRKNYTGTVYSYFTINQIDFAEAYNNPEYAEAVGLRIDDVRKTATTSTKTTNFGTPAVYLNGKKISTSEYALYYVENPAADKKDLENDYKAVGSYPIIVYGKGKNFAAPENGFEELTVTLSNGKTKVVKVPTSGYTAWQHVASYMMSKVSVASIANQSYTGKEITLNTAVYPDAPLTVTDKKTNNNLVVTFGSGKNKLDLYEGIHFNACYVSNNIDAGIVTVNLEGTGMSLKDYVDWIYNPEHNDQEIDSTDLDTRSFIGTKTIKFKIVASQKLTSSMVKLKVMQDVTDEVTGDVTQKLVDLKKGSITKTYTGDEIFLDSCEWFYNDETGEYTYGDYIVEATVKKVDENNNPVTETVVLNEGVDYEVTYKKNTNKGTATATFKGIGNYAGTVKKSFKIVAAPIQNLLVSAPDIEVTYQKNGVKPVSEVILKNSNTNHVMKNNKDYTLSFSNTTKVAVKNAETGKYEYENPKATDGNKVIDRMDINYRLLDANQENPVTKAELTVANKYMPKVVIKGKGNYTGSITLYYAITPANLKEAGVTITAKDVKYSTKNNNWATTVTLKDVNGKTLVRNTDYSKDYEYFVKDTETNDFVSVDPNKKVSAGSQMKVKVKGINNYAGENSYLEAIYYIHKESINTSKVTITWDSFDTTYDKYEKKPANIKVTYKQSKTAPRDLVKDTDYEILATNYKQNTFVGTAKITIKGIGEFTGTKTKTFRILQFKQDRVDLSKGSVLLDHEIVVDYQKGGVKPAGEIQLTYKHPAYIDALELKEGRDYKLTWYNTSKAATYYDANPEDEVSGVYVYGYTNKAKEFVEVKLPDKSLDPKSKEFKSQVSMANKYMPRVRITGLGNYKGYMDVYYTILPEDLSEVATLTAKDVKWANKNANYKTSIVVKDVNGKTLTANTDYKVNYFIKICDLKDAELKYSWVAVDDGQKKNVTVGYDNGPVNVEITAKGRIVLTEKGQEVTMKAVAYGVNAYGILDSESFVIEDEFIIKR